MNISPASIMKGAAEVKRSEVYSALAWFPFRDKKLEAMKVVQIVAFMVLCGGGFSLLMSTLALNLVMLVQVPAVFFILEGVAIVAGVLVPLALQGAKHYYLQKKLNTAQVSAILQKVQEPLTRTWEEFTLTPYYQSIAGTPTELVYSQYYNQIQPFECAPLEEGYSDGNDDSLTLETYAQSYNQFYNVYAQLPVQEVAPTTPNK